MSNHLLSPKPQKRKKKARLKISWDSPSQTENDISSQIDKFIAEIIEKAKEEYLSQIQQEPNNDVVQRHDGKVFTMEIDDNVHTTDTVHGNNDLRTNKPNPDRKSTVMSSQQCNAYEENEVRPLLDRQANQQPCLKTLQRLLHIACCHCNCLGSDVT